MYSLEINVFPGDSINYVFHMSQFRSQILGFDLYVIRTALRIQIVLCMKYRYSCDTSHLHMYSVVF